MTANEKLVYNYRRPLCEALARVFDVETGEDARIWTPYRDPEFQKVRPRFEITLDPGAGLGFLKPSAGRIASSGHMLENARQSNGNIRVVTASGVDIHDEYLTLAELLIDDLAYRANRATDAAGAHVLQYHVISSLTNTGGSGSYNSAEGEWETNLSFTMKFCFRQIAWAMLGL